MANLLVLWSSNMFEQHERQLNVVPTFILTTYRVQAHSIFSHYLKRVGYIEYKCDNREFQLTGDYRQTSLLHSFTPSFFFNVHWWLRAVSHQGRDLKRVLGVPKSTKVVMVVNAYRLCQKSKDCYRFSVGPGQIFFSLPTAVSYCTVQNGREFEKKLIFRQNGNFPQT